jgi:ABC-type nitrate/sulfonate/bicarbonate transport system substrate-binding protein
MADQPERLAPLGKVLSILLIVGLIGIGLYIAIKRNNGAKLSQGGKDPEAMGTEIPNTAGITTGKEYQYVPADKLPAVKGISQYRWNAEEKILRFSYNVWAGWLPVIAANHGTRPNTDSVFAGKHGFRVDMVLMDDPVAARDAFAAGEVHTLWGTVDMMVLLVRELFKDSRTAPRIVQQIDWSSGGDGIVLRNSIRSVADLRNKTVALAKNSRSEYYLASLLLSAGLLPSDINLSYTATVFEAAAAFATDKRIDACVSWAPDIYKIPERVEGTRVLSSTNSANKLIANVYAVRADFARDHPEIVEGLISGIFEGMDYVEQSPEQAAKWMADAFGMKPEEIMSMRDDVHSTNFAENVQFFLNSSNPDNFEHAWKNASDVFQELGRINAPFPFDQVMDFTFLQHLQKKGIFTHQKDESVASFPAETS